MGNLAINIGILVSIFLTIITFIIIVVIRFAKDEEDLQDRTLGINFLTNYTDGVALGIETSIVTGKSGRKIVTLAQRDVAPTNFDKMKEVKVVVDKNKIITLPKGTWSREKNINLYMPPSAEDFPDTLKHTEFGKMLMLWTEIQNAVNSELDMVKEGSRRKSEVLKRLGDGELSRENLITINEFQKDLVKLATDVRTREKSTGYYPSVPSSSANV